MVHKTSRLQMDIGYTICKCDSKPKRKCLKKKEMQPSRSGVFSKVEREREITEDDIALERKLV